MTEKRDPANPSSSKTEPATDEATKAYYEGLRLQGQLVDVDESTDLYRLPKRVTHIRWPDGRIEHLKTN